MDDTQIQKASDTKIKTTGTSLSIAADLTTAVVRSKNDEPVINALKNANIPISSNQAKLLSLESMLTPQERVRWERLSPTHKERIIARARRNPSFVRFEKVIKKEQQNDKKLVQFSRPDKAAKRQSGRFIDGSKTAGKNAGKAAKKSAGKAAGKAAGEAAKETAKKTAEKAVAKAVEVGVETGARVGADVATGGANEIVRAAFKAIKVTAKTVKSAVNSTEQAAKRTVDEDSKAIPMESTSATTKESNKIYKIAAVTSATVGQSLSVFLMPLLGIILAISIIVSVFATVFTTISGELDRLNRIFATTVILLSTDTKAYAAPVHAICEELSLTVDDEKNILAIIEVESHGTGNNPMQWSNDITGDGKFDAKDMVQMTPEKSLRLGIGLYKQLKDKKESTGCDLETMIQSYNYGPGFINYVMKNGGKYTYDLASKFSEKMKKEHHLKVYGDPTYVAKWKRYVGSTYDNTMSDDTFKKLHDEAFRYVGRAYVWGGNNPDKGFDCSGFTQWCYKTIGIKLPHKAQGQYDMTEHLGADNARPGDLVFFSGTYNSDSYITHVEIYIGDDQCIGAGDPIKVHKLSSKYYQEHFVCFGRVSN